MTMTNVLLATGKYAQEPYYLQGVCQSVYCVEELCYLLVKNPFMINAKLMDRDLVHWIKKECDLPELANKLEHLIDGAFSAGEFVELILNYVNYSTEEEKETVREVIQRNVGLNEYERMKRQADYLLENHRAQMALNEYDKILKNLPDTESSLRPLVFHNMGYAYAELFMFEISAKYFKRAYDMSKDPDSGKMYLAALRMFMPEADYVRFVGEHGDLGSVSLELEKQFRTAEGQFEASRENRMLSALRIYKEEGNVSSYYEEIDKLIVNLKENYLRITKE